MSSRNRSAGHGWELEMARFFRELGFPHVVTTRSESRSRDASKVDLMNKEERTNGQFVFNVQAKNMVGHVKYAKLLDEMPKEDGIINVVAHKQTQKNESGRFMGRGKYIIMNMDDFKSIVELILRNHIPLTSQVFKKRKV
jgi:hypothetical protein